MLMLLKVKFKYCRKIFLCHINEFYKEHSISEEIESAVYYIMCKLINIILTCFGFRHFPIVKSLVHSHDVEVISY